MFSSATEGVCSGWSLAVHFVVEVLWTLACCSSDICSSLAPAESIKASTVTVVHSWPPPTYTHPCARSHTHKHVLTHTGRHWHTDSHSHIQDSRPFLNTYIPHTWMRSSTVSSVPCPFGQGVLLRKSSHALQQRSANTLLDLLIDAWL